MVFTSSLAISRRPEIAHKAFPSPGILTEMQWRKAVECDIIAIGSFSEEETTCDPHDR
jgi:hypothetical protein